MPHRVAVRDEPIAIRGKGDRRFTGSMDGGAFFGSILLGYIGEQAGFPALFLTAGLSLFVGLFFLLSCLTENVDSFLSGS